MAVASARLWIFRSGCHLKAYNNPQAISHNQIEMGIVCKKWTYKIFIRSSYLLLRGVLWNTKYIMCLHGHMFYAGRKMEARELPHGSSGKGFIKSNEALQMSCASKYRMTQGKGGDERSCFTCMCPKESALPPILQHCAPHGQHAPDHPL